MARDILDYVARDMTSKDGGFFSAEDADSPVVAALSPIERASINKAATERRYQARKPKARFTFGRKRKSTMRLARTAEMFKFHFGVQPHGNAPEGSDPQDEFRGKNILIERHTIAETAEHFKKSEDEIRQSLERSREKLLSIRSQTATAASR